MALRLVEKGRKSDGEGSKLRTFFRRSEKHGTCILIADNSKNR